MIKQQSFNMMTFYHGSSVLFNRFDLSHVLEGDGKVKFGYGVYLTSKFTSAAHYSGSNANACHHYVYTVEILEITDYNHIAFQKAVADSIIQRAEAKLGNSIPCKFTSDGKLFRKYLVKTLNGSINLGGEKMASEFLLSIGVRYITWPYSWKNPNMGQNVAVLNDADIRIVQIQEVELNSKKQLVSGTERNINIP